MSFNRVRLLVKGSRHLLWVSRNETKDVSPDRGLLDGLARALRAEYYELHLVTLILSTSRDSNEKIPFVLKVARKMISREPRQPYEQEYIEVDGNLQTRKLVEALDARSCVNTQLIPYEVTKTPLKGHYQFELSALSYDPNAVPYLVQSQSSRFSTTHVDDVEIVVRASSLQSQQRASIFRQEDCRGSEGYYYSSGNVSRVNTDTEVTLRPGDRVLTV
jgi:hypothetical protein